MKTAITGSSGFIGKHLHLRLKDDLYLYSRDEGMEGIIDFNPDYIFHLAGEIYQEEEMVESNIELTHKLLNAARHMTNLKAFVAVGSSSEYGRKDHPMSETDFLDPTTMYEATKGAATLLCQAYARAYGVPAMVARPFSVYGTYEPAKRFIPTVLRLIKRDEELKLAPGVHDFIHVDDFVDGLLLLASNPQPGEVFNFGTGVQTSNRELVSFVEQIYDKKLKVKEIPSLHSYDTTSWVADISKATKLGWKPMYQLKEGLRQVIQQRLLKGI